MREKWESHGVVLGLLEVYLHQKLNGLENHLNLGDDFRGKSRRVSVFDNKKQFQLQASGTPKIAKNPRLSGANSSGRHEPSVPLGRNECEGFQFDPLPVTAATARRVATPWKINSLNLKMMVDG